MGRGDRRSGKGKRFRGSFGNRRPHNQGRKAKDTAQTSTPHAAPPARVRP